MNKYLVKIIIIRRLIILLIASVLFVNCSAIMIYLYISKTVYPAVAFLMAILICYIVGRRILQKEIEIQIISDSIYIDKQKFLLSELISYNFDNTNYIHKALLNFTNNKIRLYVLKRNDSEYLNFTKNIEAKIRLLNIDNINKINKYDWHETTSAKIYGYITAIVLILWIIMMFLYPEKLKFSNLGLFFIVLAGLSPILFKIFGNKKSK